jgi:hypothetical protein
VDNQRIADRLRIIEHKENELNGHRVVLPELTKSFISGSLFKLTYSPSFLGNIYLTPYAPDIVKDGAPTDDSTGGAGASEFEVTPAMIEAGVIPLLRFHRERSNDEDVVREIYLAMRRAEACSP